MGLHEMSLTAPESQAPRIFIDAGRVFRADTCDPLKAAASECQLELSAWARGNYPGERLPEDLLPGLRSIGVWDAHSRQTWGLGEHCNEGIEVMLVSRGTVGFRSASVETVLAAGDLTFTAPWEVHEVGRPNVDACRVIWFILDVGVRRPNQEWTWPEWIVLARTEKQHLEQAPASANGKVWPGAHLAHHFEAIAGLLQGEDPATSETDVKLRVNAILLALARKAGSATPLASKPTDPARETVRLFLERLPEHLDYPWKVEEMAQQCGVSKVSFFEHCRALLNRTPHAHLMSLRLERAREMLALHPSMTLTEIAIDCGFSSSAHFSTTFRKAVGETPSRYRKAVRR